MWYYEIEIVIFYCTVWFYVLADTVFLQYCTENDIFNLAAPLLSLSSIASTTLSVLSRNDDAQLYFRSLNEDDAPLVYSLCMSNDLFRHYVSLLPFYIILDVFIYFRDLSRRQDS